MDCFPVQEECLMHRFYIDSGVSDDEACFLSPEDARHAVTVLRLKTGQKIEAVRNGVLWDAEITGTDAGTVKVRLIDALPSREAELSVTLFQGLPKADKMDLIVQKATELGVVRIVPLVMDRCVARPDRKDITPKLERWNKIAREAGKQSGRCVIPEVVPPVLLKDISRFPDLPETNVALWEEATCLGPLSFSKSHPGLSSLGILVGPEGGIEKSEIDLLASAGFTSLTLGKRILRTETAGMAAVAALMSLYGEME